MEDDEPTPATANVKVKKVRIACQRCRDRRIKCDDQLPACSKCAKAGVPCIEVHARSDERQMPRSHQSDANARLQWLESLVKERLPEIDLAKGPPPLQSALESGLIETGSGDVARHASAVLGKRARHPNQESGQAMHKRARSMAVDLGLLSLDINASQVRYLGSSSGSFFASLLQNHHDARTHAPLNIEHQDEPQDQAGQSADATGDKNGPGEHSAGPANLVCVLKDILPPRKQCNSLIEQFFAHYHADYPVLHKPSFETMVDALYACTVGSELRPRQSSGWPADVTPFAYNGEATYAHEEQIFTIHIKVAAAQLFFVLSIAAYLDTRRRSFSVNPTKYHEQALALSQAGLSTVSLPSLQLMTLLILQGFLVPQGGNIWITLHVAMAYAIDLGIHRDVADSTRFTPVALQMRRRVFFCIYTLDRLVSTIQGRPLGFQDDTLDLSISSLDPERDLSDRSSTRDERYLSYSVARFRWIMLVSSIKFDFYRFQEVLATEIVENMQARAQDQLEEWLENALRATDVFTSPEQVRFRTKLQIDYHTAICLLYQPSQICPRPQATALQRCYDSATERIRLYDAQCNQQQLDVSWPTAHGIVLAGATLVYCIWASPEVRSQVTISGLARDFRLCSNLLVLASEWWPLANRGRRSFERLADITVESLSKQGPSVEQDQITSQVPSLEDDVFATTTIQDPLFNIEETLQAFLRNEHPWTDTFDMFGANSGDGWHDDDLFSTSIAGQRF